MLKLKNHLFQADRSIPSRHISSNDIYLYIFSSQQIS